MQSLSLLQDMAYLALWDGFVLRIITQMMVLIIGSVMVGSVKFQPEYSVVAVYV